MSGEPLPTVDEMREASRRGISVYRLRLERGTAGQRVTRRTLPLRREFTPAVTLGKRIGDTLALIIHATPRSKKNSREFVWRTKEGRRYPVPIPPAAWRAFRDEVLASFRFLKSELCLPLPDRDYRLSCVLFLSDDRADVDNLVTSILDVLQECGVFRDDRRIRSITAEAIVDASSPRIALTLAPYERNGV